MALLVSDLVTAGTLAKAGNYNVVSARGSVAVDGDLTADDIMKLVPLPANCVLMDLVLDTDDLDTHETPTITLDVGILNAAFDAIESGQEFLTESTIAQAGGVVRASTSIKALCRIPPSMSTRYLGVKVHTAAATAAASGTVGLTVTYRLDEQVMFDSEAVKNYANKPTSAKAGAVMMVRGSVSLPATLKATDVIRLAVLPAQCELIDFTIDTDDLDSGAALLIDYGLLTALAAGWEDDDGKKWYRLGWTWVDNQNGKQATLDGSNTFLSSSTSSRTAGITRSSLKTVPRAASSNIDRYLAAYISTRAANRVAGTLGFTLSYRSV